MRLLFSHAGGSGHLMPLIPFAREAASRGHELGFIAQARTRRQIESSGFSVIAEVETPGEREVAAAFDRGNALPTLFEQVDHGLREVFAGIYVRKQVPTVVEACNHWQPDLIIRDEADFGSAIASELAGIPCVTILVVAAGSFVRGSLVADPLNALRADFELPPDPRMRMLEGDLTLCPFPPSFREPLFPLPANGVAVRTEAIRSNDRNKLPRWFDEMPDCPTIYFSLGTVFNTIRKDLFTPVIEGIRDLPVNLVVTVGRNVDPLELGTQPSNVHVEHYIPQTALLPYCDLVVNHAGSGSLNGAFAHGLPVVVIPLGADQPYNARRCVEIGIGELIEDTDLTPARIRSIAWKLLTNPSYRRRAERLHGELSELPGIEHAIDLFEALS